MNLRSTRDIFNSMEGHHSVKMIYQVTERIMFNELYGCLSEYKIYVIMWAEETINTKITKNFIESVLVE